MTDSVNAALSHLGWVSDLRRVFFFCVFISFLRWIKAF